MVQFAVKSIFADNKSFMAFFCKNDPFDIFFAVGCVVILLIGAKEHIGTDFSF